MSDERELREALETAQGRVKLLERERETLGASLRRAEAQAARVPELERALRERVAPQAGTDEERAELIKLRAEIVSLRLRLAPRRYPRGERQEVQMGETD